MRIASSMLLLLAAVVASACTASMEGAPCPCVEGYVCSPQTQTCQPFAAAADAAFQGEIDAAELPKEDGGLADASVADASVQGIPDAGGVPDAGRSSDAGP